MGMEMAMTLPERIKATEGVETAASARGPARPFAAAAHAAIPIIES